VRGVVNLHSGHLCSTLHASESLGDIGNLSLPILSSSLRLHDALPHLGLNLLEPLTDAQHWDTVHVSSEMWKAGLVPGVQKPLELRDDLRNDICAQSQLINFRPKFHAE
jgi:hypothetical protein